MPTITTRPVARRVLAGALGAALLLAACGTDGDTETTGDPSTTAGATTDATTAPTGDDSLDGSEVDWDRVVQDESSTIPIERDDPLNQDPIAPGATRIRYQVGPIDVLAGQNNIDFTGADVPKPTEPGWITRISANLHRGDGSVPPVDVIHLHHGVWLNNSRKDTTAPNLPERVFASGEEKTVYNTPGGYGYRHEPDDAWVINYMIHNLFPEEEQIWITYDLDFIADTAPEADDITEAWPVWMDVDNPSIYPVFDVLKGTGGEDGLYTYPDEAPEDERADALDRSSWTVPEDGVIIGGGGHLHPGGKTVDLFVERDGAEEQIFSSEAIYYEPAGAVSWDVSMTVTPLDYRVALRAGDELKISTTYFAEEASWYESMGIAVLWMTAGDDGDDPFEVDVNVPGEVTHGHLPENDNHGGEESPSIPDPTGLPDGSYASLIGIEDFLYLQGDFSESETDIPLVRAGESITYDNTYDAPLANGIWHTITSCQAPCNRATGIAYPVADAEVQFDSGQLGDAGPPTAGRLTWDTPTDLDPGTYTYFCRVHPFMRGAFRVVDE